MDTSMMLNFIVTMVLLRIAYVDHKTMEIPDKLNLVLMICGVVSCILNPHLSVSERVVGTLAVSVPMFLLCKVIPGAFGGGDIKLVAAMGFYLGWKQLLIGTYVGFLIGGAQAVYLLVTGNVRKGEGSHMAFGPALCIGMLAAMFYGEELLQQYAMTFY